jgi:excinuclease ABC subunit B
VLEIVVEGTVGAGKTALVEILEREWGMRGFYEMNDELADQLLERYYADRHRWCLTMELYFLHKRFLQLQQASRIERAVMDRSMLGDFVFVRMQKHLGFLQSVEYTVYEQFYGTMSKISPQPKLLVYIKCSAETAMKRIRKRGRPYEMNVEEEYWHQLVTMNIQLHVGQKIEPHEVAQKLARIGYSRSSEITLKGCFRLAGDVLEIYPTYQDEGIRVEFFGSNVDRIESFDKMNRTSIEEYQKITIYPAVEFITTEEKLRRAVESIKEELKERLEELKRQGKLLEMQRLQQRTMHDLELLISIGHCPGIENYSRHFDGRQPGEPPYTLLDYFDEDFIVFIDESHIAVPQLRAMWRGEFSRKKNLVDYGFRLPSAYDNRPLTFEEFLKKVPQIIFVSATPGPFEFQVSEQIVEQLIRPTGLVDPEVEVRPTSGQIDDLVFEIKKVVERGERALVTVLTKKTAERLSEYLTELGIRALYIHSELDAIERIEVLKKLRRGNVDVVVGINLLREGLDLPEVSLVAIMDCDKEGFLRSETTLIQIMGRVARNLNGKVLMYADRITPAMQRAIEETNRRRKIQLEYNKKHNITPKPIIKPLQMEIFEKFIEEKPKLEYLDLVKDLGLEERIAVLEEEMYRAASELRYEDAAVLRDEIFRLKEELRKNEAHL